MLPSLEDEHAGGSGQSSGPSRQASWTRGTFKAVRSQFWAVEQLPQGFLACRALTLHLLDF